MRASTGTYKGNLLLAIKNLRRATDNGLVPDTDEAELLEAVVLLQKLLTRKPVEVNHQDES